MMAEWIAKESVDGESRLYKIRDKESRRLITEFRVQCEEHINDLNLIVGAPKLLEKAIFIERYLIGVISDQVEDYKGFLKVLGDLQQAIGAAQFTPMEHYK
jgi:hypothetical protein